MSEKDRDQREQESTETPVGPFRWLIDPERGPLLPLSGLWILTLDWVLFSSNLLSAGLATPVVVAIGFVLGAGGTFYLQKRFAHDRHGMASLKALVAGVVVGVPWPLTGTVVGGWVLLASGVKNPAKNAIRSSSAIPGRAREPAKQWTIVIVLRKDWLYGGRHFPG